MTENERVKEVRRTKGLTLERFGQILGVGKTAISKIERGENNVTNQMRQAIAREFHVSEQWLLTGEGEMFLETAEDEEITRFMGDILTGKPDIRRRLISVLARMTPEQWAMLEEKIKELMSE